MEKHNAVSITAILLLIGYSVSVQSDSLTISGRPVADVEAKFASLDKRGLYTCCPTYSRQEDLDPANEAKELIRQFYTHRFASTPQ